MLVIYKTLRTRVLPFDEAALLCGAILAVLQHEEFQKLLIEDDNVELMTTLFLDMYNLDFVDTASGKVFALTDFEAEQLKRMESQQSTAAELIDALARRPEFIVRYPPDSDLAQHLACWLSKPQPAVQMCACRVLGELSADEDRATELFQALQSSRKISNLLDLLSSPSNDDVASIGLGLMKNLALPPQNKSRLAEKYGILDVIMNLCCKTNNMEVRTLAVQVLKAMMFRCYQSAIQFLWTDGPGMRQPSTHVARILSLYHEHDDLALRMEIARFFGGIFRVAHLTSQESGNLPFLYANNAIKQAEQADLDDTNLAVPLCALITDSSNQSLITEGWASLVLAAETNMGAEMLYLFFKRESTMRTFQEIIGNVKRDSHDYNNVFALRSKLLTYCVRGSATLLSCKLANCYCIGR